MDEKEKVPGQDEKKALLCIRSLVNISNDLKSIEQPVFARLASFIAAGLLDVYRPDVPEAQFHGGQTPHKSNIKDEITAAIDQVRNAPAVPEKTKQEKRSYSTQVWKNDTGER